jgi:hypothetical protein
MYFLLNSGQAFSMLRGYLPMLLSLSAGQPGAEPPVNAAEIEEIFSLLTGSMVSLRRTRLAPEGVVCSEKFATVLTPVATEVR